MKGTEVREGPSSVRHILQDDGMFHQGGRRAAKWIVATLAVIGALTLAIGIGVGVAKVLEWIW